MSGHIIILPSHTGKLAMLFQNNSGGLSAHHIKLSIRNFHVAIKWNSFVSIDPDDDDDANCLSVWMIDSYRYDTLRYFTLRTVPVEQQS